MALRQRTQRTGTGTAHASGEGDPSVLGDGWLHLIGQLPAPEPAA